MNRPVVFRPEARAEFDAAFDWYEPNRHGLGVDFMAAVHEILDRLADMPESHQQVAPGVRRAVVRRFPYSVLYRAEADQIVVLAIFHARRDPRIWAQRVQYTVSEMPAGCRLPGLAACVDEPTGKWKKQ